MRHSRPAGPTSITWRNASVSDHRPGITWRQLVFEPEPADLERLESALFECGALAVSLQDAGDEPILEPLPGETPLWPRARVTALFAGADDLDAVLALLRAAFGVLPAHGVDVLEERVWEREWLEHAVPLRFGDRLWVCPGDFVPGGDAAVVRLDPGLAFGTGSHPSTALCLDWLAAHEPAGLDVVDFGCGSGVLAIAALKLGARRAIAIDIDRQARAATRENARRNGVTLAVQKTSCDATRGDVVLANIVAGTLIELRARLADIVRPGGRAVLAGLLVGQEAAVAEAYRTWFHIGAAARRDGWIRIEATRRA